MKHWIARCAAGVAVILLLGGLMVFWSYSHAVGALQRDAATLTAVCPRYKRSGTWFAWGPLPEYEERRFWWWFTYAWDDPRVLDGTVEYFVSADGEAVVPNPPGILRIVSDLEQRHAGCEAPLTSYVIVPEGS